MPNTRPGIKFVDDICSPCINYEKQKATDWNSRKKEFEKICDKHRGSNGNSYDCAIAISGGKDSHFQVYYMKEVMKMNPLLLSVGNIDWTETGRDNLNNISDAFSCDIISFLPNRNIAKKLARKAFEKIGSPTWYIDALIYSFPYKMAIKMGIKLLVYGENVNYTYGGTYNEETSSAMLQPLNDVVKPVWNEWVKENDISKKELEAVNQPSIKECEEFGLEPIYLSYFVPWDSHHNYEVAKKWGFKHLEHEHKREGTLENYNQIDSLGYLINQYLKYLKYGHASATEMASRWIRSGLVKKEEIINDVEKLDKNLDQEVISRFCDFTKMSIPEFWKIMDKWYNRDLFEQDNDGVWHSKFKVGQDTI